MNCDDYLAMLATTPAGALAHGPARDHAASCPSCSRATSVVAERERNLLMGFDHFESALPAAPSAASTLAASRRRKVSLFYRLALAAVIAATVGGVLIARGNPSSPAVATIKETFRLQCLSPEQAGELIRPHLKATDRVWFRPKSPLGIITVDATPEDMAAVRSVLDRYDNATQSQCTVQVKVPKEP